MKLEKAIEHNEALWRELDIPERAKQRESVWLGIEALKNYKEMKDMGEISRTFMLPGETEE